jgi:hypothetical protein
VVRHGESSHRDVPRARRDGRHEIATGSGLDVTAIRTITTDSGFDVLSALPVTSGLGLVVMKTGSSRSGLGFVVVKGVVVTPCSLFHVMSGGSTPPWPGRRIDRDRSVAWGIAVWVSRR